MRPLAIAMVLSLAACAVKYETKLMPTSKRGQLDRESKYLKVHMLDGRLFVLTNWLVDDRSSEVVGTGESFNAERNRAASGNFRVPIAEVALFETNAKKVHGSIVAMTVITGLSVALTIACLTNPKACFGSCPTIYAETKAGTKLLAEAFSSSIAPSLEATDIDSLYWAASHDRQLELVVTNEAFETHVIRHFDVLAARRPEGGRVFADASGEAVMWAGTAIEPPRACRANEGDCLAEVTALDDNMRASVTDGVNLASREVVELDIGTAEGVRRGLIIGARHTFLSTYLFYQALAWLGSEATATLAQLERGDASTRDEVKKVVDLLGAIDVWAEVDGQWQRVGSFQETGPLATDVKVLPLPEGAGGKVRLDMTRGNWRIDWLATATLGEQVAVQRVQPSSAADDALRDPKKTTVHLPGTRKTLRYQLPEGDLELFLESRGYYLEWMRDEWVAEESKLSAALLLRKPAWALRLMAAEFKRVEPKMEEMFWNSRFRPWASEEAGR